MLTVPSGTGAWVWVGCRLRPNPLLTAEERADPSQLARHERGWLAEQQSRQPWRMELRFETPGRPDPRWGTAPLSAALIGQTFQADPRLVNQAAAWLGERLLALPRHVVAEPLDETALSAALAPGPLAWAAASGGLGLVEVRKRVLWGEFPAPSGVPWVGLAFPQLTGETRPWAQVWGELARQPRPTALGVWLEPYPSGSAAFREGLRALHGRFVTLAQTRAPSPVFGRPQPGDAFAEHAAARYGSAVLRYAADGYRLRVWAASAGPAPRALARLAAQTLGAADGETVVVTPEGEEADAAWDNVTGLWNGWLTGAYRQDVPGRRVIEPLEQVLSDLVDVREASAAFRLPFETPGHPSLFAPPPAPGPGVPGAAAATAPPGDDPGQPWDFEYPRGPGGPADDEESG